VAGGIERKRRARSPAAEDVETAKPGEQARAEEKNPCRDADRSGDRDPERELTRPWGSRAAMAPNMKGWEKKNPGPRSRTAAT
jgi:hypothetical protein